MAKKNICYECEEIIEDWDHVEMIKVDGHPQTFHALGCAENYRDNMELFKQSDSQDN